MGDIFCWMPCHDDHSNAGVTIPYDANDFACPCPWNPEITEQQIERLRALSSPDLDGVISVVGYKNQVPLRLQNVAYDFCNANVILNQQRPLHDLTVAIIISNWSSRSERFASVGLTTVRFGLVIIRLPIRRRLCRYIGRAVRATYIGESMSIVAARLVGT